MHTLNPYQSAFSRKMPYTCVWSSFAMLAAALFGAHMLFAVQAPAAQAPAAQSAPSLSHKAVHPSTHPRVVQAKTPPAQTVAAPVTPPAPELPHWPANDKPAEATVTWDSKGLHIEAANSSLRQILKDVSTVTGVKIEGLGADERVFGVYGPGQARDVLSQLLHGSGYNVMMIGDLGQGTPRQIVLSSRQRGETQNIATKSAASNNDDEDTDNEEQPQPQTQPLVPVPNRPAIVPVIPPRTPQQIMQEMQQRQQQQLVVPQ